jgi:hypothetical protein
VGGKTCPEPDLARLKKGLAARHTKVLPITPAISQRAADSKCLIEHGVSQNVTLAFSLVTRNFPLPLKTLHAKPLAQHPGIRCETSQIGTRGNAGEPAKNIFNTAISDFAGGISARSAATSRTISSIARSRISSPQRPLMGPTQRYSRYSPATSSGTLCAPRAWCTRA